MQGFKINNNAIAQPQLPRLIIAGVGLLNALAMGRGSHREVFQTKAHHEGCLGGHPNAFQAGLWARDFAISRNLNF